MACSADGSLWLTKRNIGPLRAWTDERPYSQLMTSKIPPSILRKVVAALGALVRGHRWIQCKNRSLWPSKFREIVLVRADADSISYKEGFALTQREKTIKLLTLVRDYEPAPDALSFYEVAARNLKLLP